MRGRSGWSQSLRKVQHGWCSTSPSGDSASLRLAVRESHGSIHAWEKAEDRGSLLWSETRCCLMPLRVWCHCNLLRKEAESSKRGSSTWMGLREQYYFLCWHTRFPVISICWASFSPKNKINGNFDFCSDCAWQLSVSWFLCTGSLLPLTEAGIWAVTAMLSGPPRAS